jgi:hypothetical protein
MPANVAFSMQLPEELTPAILDANPALLAHKSQCGCMFFSSFQLSKIGAYAHLFLKQYIRLMDTPVLLSRMVILSSHPPTGG